MSNARNVATRVWIGLPKLLRHVLGDRRFSDIVRGRSQAFVVYETPTVMAFLDVQPEAPGHTLVIPKRQIAGMLQADERTLCDIYEAARLIAKAQINSLGAEGVRLLQANGRAAGQSVHHLHLHVIPSWCPLVVPPSDEPTIIAAALKTALRASFSTTLDETPP